MVPVIVVAWWRASIRTVKSGLLPKPVASGPLKCTMRASPLMSAPSSA
jgi:hypothetical protein